MKNVVHRTPALRFGFLTIALLAVVLMAVGCSDDDPDVTYPTPPKAPSKLWMYDVFGNDANDVYACGYGGTMAHFDGTSWTEVDLGTSNNVVTIWGQGDGTLYACGGGGSVWKNSSGSWDDMDSGSSRYLVALGSYFGDICVGGTGGALRKLVGSSWNDTPSSLILRDPSGAPLDTLSRNDDIESLVTINHYFVGGAFRKETWDAEDSIGTDDTDGMVLGPDLDYPDEPEYGRFDWQMRPLRADEIAYSEWIQCSTSDNEILGNNYLGTSEGWVFQLSRNEEDRLVWAKMYPRITSDPRSGINDMWLDAEGNLYMVTHSGQIVFQTHDYFVDEETFDVTGRRVVQQEHANSLTGIWGSDADHIFVVGLIEKMVYRYQFDDVGDEFVTVANDTLDFVSKSFGSEAGEALDKFGRPLAP